jgi:hypothetical protein
LACDVANMQIAHGLVCLEMGYIHKNIPKIPNKTTFRPKPDVCLYPNNPLKQYDILVTRGWKITLAIRSDFAFRWLAIRRDLSMSQDMRDQHWQTSGLNGLKGENDQPMFIQCGAP